jgi:hypothetical protein
MSAGLGERGPLSGELLRGLQLHALVFGLALSGPCIALELAYRGKPYSQNEMERVLLRASCAFVALYWLALAIVTHTGVIEGVRYWWLSDDQMISMRYARNLVEGNGLVWNPGNRVEGFSNPLWVFYMAAIHWLLPLPQHQISLIILGTNVALAVAALPFLFRIVDLLGGGLAAKFVSACLYSVSAPLLYFTITGWEHSLLVLLTLAAVDRVLRDVQIKAASWGVCALLGLIALVRIDAALISAVLGLVVLLHASDRWTAICRLAVAALFPVSYELFRVAYYGEWVPNTYYLKVSEWDRWMYGVEVVKSFLLEYAVAVFATLVGLLVALRRREYLIVLTLILVHVAYMWWTGGAGPGSRKYLVPVLPLMLATTAVTIEIIAGWLRWPGWAMAALLAITLVGPKAVVPGNETKFLVKLRNGEYENVKIGHALNRLDPSVLVCDGGAGQVFYFGGTRGHDYLGVNDKYIARLKPAVQIAVSGHSKFDFNYSISQLKPDYIVGTLPSNQPLDDATINKHATGNWPQNGRLYQNPDFIAHCMRNPMPWDTPRVVYRCIWRDDAGPADGAADDRAVGA